LPPQYEDDPVLFVAQVMALPLLNPQPPARVVINQRTGSVVIDGEIEIGPVVITHKNITIETGEPGAGDRVVPVDLAQSDNTRLKALVDALNALRVPTADLIEILKTLERSGKLHELHGAVVVE
jgi:flagellar P-ring protein precursor FlgI